MFWECGCTSVPWGRRAAKGEREVCGAGQRDDEVDTRRSCRSGQWQEKELQVRLTVAELSRGFQEPDLPLLYQPFFPAPVASRSWAPNRSPAASFNLGALLVGKTEAFRLGPEVCVR